MPWTPAEASKHTKAANTRKKKRQWAAVANSILKKTKNEGRAIKGANSAVSGDCKITSHDALNRWVEGYLASDAKTDAERLQHLTVSFDEEHPFDPADPIPKEHYPDPDDDDDDDDEKMEELMSAQSDDIEEDEDMDDDYSEDEEMDDREFTTEQRKSAAKSGAAMPGGGFPIKNKSDLHNAIRAIGRAKNRAATIKHIKARAKALGAESEIPSSWGDAMYNPKIADGARLVQVSMSDTITVDDAAEVRFIDGGYLVAMPRIARTGIQLYAGKECGFNDKETVRVYRPESEVFATDAVHSYTHLPVTDDHPNEMVTAKNWAKYAKGDTGDEILRDGRAVRVPMMLRDSATIDAFKDGKNQLSVGYTCDIEATSGVTPDGEKYDCIQRNIRANHLAVVSAARGGPTLKIGDDDMKGVNHMSNVTLTLDNIKCEMSETSAQIVKNTLDRYQVQLDAAKKKSEESEKECDDAKKDAAAKDAVYATKATELDTQLKAKDAQIATLQQQLKDAELTPAKLDAEVAIRTSTIDKAKSILPAVIVDGRNVADIRKQVVQSKLGEQASAWDANMIQASFDTLTAGVVATKSNPISDAVTAFSKPGFVANQQQVADAAREAAYTKYDEDAANQWQNAGKAN
jgi:hypothetical protein